MTAERSEKGIPVLDQSAEPPQEQEPLPEQIARRRFLRNATLIGAGVAAAGAGVLRLDPFGAAAGASQGTTSAKGADHQWCMIIDLRTCDGCKACTKACQAAHYLHEDQTWIRVFTMQSASSGTYHMPRPCMMCENPPCVQVCPVNANIRTDEGLVLVDQKRCIGTRICMSSCPYEARYFNWSDPVPAPRQPVPQEPAWPVPQVKGTVGKCIFCAAMLPMGKLPECVSGCPMGVLYLGDLATDLATNSLGKAIKISTFLAENDAVTFKEEYGTRPRVYYILGHGQDLNANPVTG